MSGQVYPQTDPPFQAPNLDAVDVSQPILPGPIDSDGDGQPDTVTSENPMTVITRGDGKVTLAKAGLAVFIGGTVGDLDGDGRDEIVVVIADPNTVATIETRVVPGSIAPGTYDPTLVGTKVPEGFKIAIPDRNGDGADEFVNLMSGPGAATTAVFSGADVAAVPPPGDASGITPLITLPGLPKATADLQADPVAIVTGSYEATPDGNVVVLHVLVGNQVIDFTTAPGPTPASYFPGGVGGVSVFEGNGGTYLVLGQASRSGSFVYYFRVDQPCGPIVERASATTTTTMPTTTTTMTTTTTTMPTTTSTVTTATTVTPSSVAPATTSPPTGAGGVPVAPGAQPMQGHAAFTG